MRKTKRSNGQKDQDNTYSSSGGSGIGTSNSASPPKSESASKPKKRKSKESTQPTVKLGTLFLKQKNIPQLTIEDSPEVEVVEAVEQTGINEGVFAQQIGEAFSKMRPLN